MVKDIFCCYNVTSGAGVDKAASSGKGSFPSASLREPCASPLRFLCMLCVLTNNVANNLFHFDASKQSFRKIQAGGKLRENIHLKKSLQFDSKAYLCTVTEIITV